MSEAREKAIKSIFKGGAIVFIGSIISKLISLLFRILVGRTGVGEYGQVSVMIAVFSFSMLFAQIGVPNGVQRFIAYYLGSDEKEKAIGSFQTGIKIVTASSLLTASVLFFSADWLAASIFNNPDLALLIKMAAVVLPFRTYGALGMHVTNALEKMQYAVFNDKILVNITQLGLAALLISLGYGYLGAAFAYAVTFVLGGILAMYFAYHEFPELFRTRSTFRNFGEIFHHSWPLILAGLFAKITGNIDTFMIQGFLSSEKVGLYQAAFPFASALTVAGGVFSTIFLSNASEMVSRGSMDELRSTYRTVVKWVSIAMVPMFLIGFVFPRAVLTLFGSEYYGAAGILRVLSAGFVLHALVGPASNIYQAIEKTTFNFYTTALVGISNLVLNVVLIPVLGVMGAAWASTISMGVSALVNGVLVWRILGQQPFRFSVVKVWAAGLLAIGGVYAVTNALFTYTPAWFLPVDIVLFGLLYAVLLLMMRTLEEDDLLILKAIREKTGQEVEWLERLIRRFT